MVNPLARRCSGRADEFSPALPTLHLPPRFLSEVNTLVLQQSGRGGCQLLGKNRMELEFIMLNWQGAFLGYRNERQQ